MSIVIEKSTRVERLKATMVRKDFQTWKEPGQKHLLRWGPKGTNVRMCLERARLLTESYKQTEGQPEVIRRAKALAHILENMTIYIKDSELIVGNFASDGASLPIYPEMATEWLENEVRGQWHDLLDEEGYHEFEKIMDYWRNRCIDGRVKDLLPKHLIKWIKYTDNGGIVSADEFQADRAWLGIDFGKVLNMGLEGIIKQAEKRLNELSADVPKGPNIGNWTDKINNLRAIVIACQAAVTFANRFSQLARDKAAMEQDEVRKNELLTIAYNCQRVPKYPATSLHQAFQSWWFTYLIGYIIETLRHASPCRFDQLMYPFYRKDKEEGRISREKAQEFMELLAMKFEDTGQIAPPSFHVVGSGVTLYQKLTIGGTDEYGQDASNEFSFIMLDAAMATHSCQTQIALRYHPKINHELLLKTIDCIKSGVGYPDIYNDSVIVPWWSERGAPVKISRNYAIGGCVSMALPGKNTQARLQQACYLSVGKCLELALNQGKDFRTGKQIGCPTPDPLGFTSVNDVMEAYLKQVNFAFDNVAKIENIALEVYRRYGQVPFNSALIDGCIEKGMDCTEWTEYPYHQVIYAGAINVADSLAAINRFVFEEKAITMKELLTALRDNFEGHEELRQRLLNEAPKFGNDDDRVDSIAREVIHRTKEEIEKFTDIWGIPWTMDGSIAGGYYGAGRATWALPDGKREGRVDAYADGTVSPAAGRDRRGPTAVIKSMAKVGPPFSQTANQKFMPQFLEGDYKGIFADYLKTWADLGNWHIQFNVVDKETLLEAQKNPEKYPGLIVRVAGYSAYFIDLPKGLQDDVIARTAQSFI